MNDDPSPEQIVADTSSDDIVKSNQFKQKKTNKQNYTNLRNHFPAFNHCYCLHYVCSEIAENSR